MGRLDIRAEQTIVLSLAEGLRSSETHQSRDWEATMRSGRKKRSPAAERALARKTKRGWDTSDAEEIDLRVNRAIAEPMTITNLEPYERFFSTFEVDSAGSGMRYRVEIRSLTSRQNSCTCTDFRVNGLGTCKHVEAVLAHLRAKPRVFKRAAQEGSPNAEIYLRRQGSPIVCIQLPRRRGRGVGKLASRFFDTAGELLGVPEDAVPALQRAVAQLGPKARSTVRLASEVHDWVEHRTSAARRAAARKAFDRDLRAGKRTVDMLRYPLYDYQVEGMLHLAFGERVMLVDDMGLGKTVQAVAACALLKELRGIQRVLVVCPASLKTEWEEQIKKFTDLPMLLMFGLKHHRIQKYRQPSFFYLTNYEQILRDVREINEILAPDVIILDEAQRIKNWNTKTAQAVKRLASPCAFVLTGTPLENRIDEIYSITEFLDPHLFGPLFRFNREFYTLDERGRPAGYKNLAELRRRIRPVMLRRHKDEVEDQLPERVDNNFFVGMSKEQLGPYREYEQRVASLMQKAKIRPLTKEEHDNLQKWLACMRMLCDTTYILNPDSKVSPKIHELERIFEDAGILNGRKAIIFSEWKRMLELVRDLVEEMGLGYAWHVGEVPQRKRRKEINRFKEDPDCRLFLSTDSGGVGLNLQAASVVVNLDLPWNPAKLEQRIARAWRKHQPSAVNVINLVSEGTIEHRMLGTLAIKRELADGIVDGRGDLANLKMPSGREAFLARLKLIMGMDMPAEAERPRRAARPTPRKKLPPKERFRQNVLAELPGRVQLIEIRPVPETGAEAALVVVDRQPEEVAGVITRLHRDAYEGKPAGCVEVLDKRTYETIQRLATHGLVNIAGQQNQEMHRSPALKRPGPTPEQMQRKRATQLAADAEKKLKMSQVLAQGGFPAEALGPIRDSVELSVRALFVLAGDQDAGKATEPLPARRIHGELVSCGWLDAADASQVSSLREMASDGEGIDDATAQRLVEAGASIVRKASDALAREALKA